MSALRLLQTGLLQTADCGVCKQPWEGELILDYATALKLFITENKFIVCCCCGQEVKYWGGFPYQRRWMKHIRPYVLKRMEEIKQLRKDTVDNLIHAK